MKFPDVAAVKIGNCMLIYQSRFGYSWKSLEDFFKDFPKILNNSDLFSFSPPFSYEKGNL